MNGKNQSALAAWGPTMLRLAVGAVFVAHGYDKVFIKGVPQFSEGLTKMGLPYPLTLAGLSALTELVGGVLMLVGLGVRLVAVPMAINMAVAISLVHSQSFFAPKGMEYPLTLLLIFMALMFTGAGRLALDSFFVKRPPAPAMAPVSEQPLQTTDHRSLAA
ncbi:MAG: DoxX family protein [Armatimonadetes bacterium]|nr:DoxX family protein [Armatimonadota bacterium]